MEIIIILFTIFIFQISHIWISFISFTFFFYFLLYSFNFPKCSLLFLVSLLFFWEEKESSCSICENNKGAQKGKMNWKTELINRFIIFSDLFCSYPKKNKTIALSFPNPIQIHTLFTFFCFCCCWNFHNKVIIIIIIMITRNKKRLLSRLDKDFRPN